MSRYLICNKCHSIFEEPDFLDDEEEELRCPCCYSTDLDTLDVNGSIPSAERITSDE